MIPHAGVLGLCCLVAVAHLVIAQDAHTAPLPTQKREKSSRSPTGRTKKHKGTLSSEVPQPTPFPARGATFSGLTCFIVGADVTVFKRGIQIAYPNP